MGELPPCEFGAKCYRSNPKHFLEFSHPWGANGELEGLKDPPSKDSKRKAMESEMPQLELGTPNSPTSGSENDEDDEDEGTANVESSDDEPLVPMTPKKAKLTVKTSPAVAAREEKAEFKEKGGALLTMAESLTDPEWRIALAAEFAKPYFQKIEEFVAKERASTTIWPAQEEVFAALNSTPLSKVKVVIIGQDPYFNPNQGHGLCFSVRKGIKRPPSLLRIYKEIERDYPSFVIPKHGFLQEWADRGILLLNATLTVQQGKANSHKACGWQKFTDAVIQVVNSKLNGVVFMLWGGFAQKKGKVIDLKKHSVLNGAHPSPLGGSAWIGCSHFKKANAALVAFGREPVDWNISP